jgi:hypothetical protein
MAASRFILKTYVAPRGRAIGADRVTNLQYRKWLANRYCVPAYHGLMARAALALEAVHIDDKAG